MDESCGRRMREMLYGTWVAQAIYAAARLDLADHVAAGRHEICELARATDADPRALYRLMRALASVGVFREEEPERFVSTPLADCLRSGADESVKDLALFYGGEMYRSYAEIVDSVRTGAPAFERVYGTSLWEHLDRTPAAGAMFRRAMGATSWREQLALPRTYDFGGIERLVDVGGGEGSMLAAILHERPALRGVLVDIPSGLDRTMRHFRDAGVADRCTLHAGSADDALPAGDGYLLSCLLHAMDDDVAVRVLGRVRDAIAPAGRVVIVERIVGPRNEPGLSKLLDLSMLVVPGGRERTECEWRELLCRSGFELRRVIPLPYFSGGMELHAIEGGPVGRAAP
jgi:hypothetical protein